MTEVSVSFIHTNNPGNLSPSSLSTTRQGINGSAHTESTHTGLAHTEYTTVRFYNSRPQSDTGVPEFESSSVIIGTIVAASALFVVVIATLIFLKVTISLSNDLDIINIWLTGVLASNYRIVPKHDPQSLISFYHGGA